MSWSDLFTRGGPVMAPIFGISILIFWLGLRQWFRLGGSPASGTEVRRAENTLRGLKILTGTAPYLGLLGTVGGMMMAFEGLIRFGPGNLRGLSGGIARALVTTQAGLLVALTGLLFLVFLEGRLRRVEATMTAGRGRRRGRRWRHG